MMDPETPENPCPVPWKRVFVSRREAAQSTLNGIGNRKPKAQLRPYHCTCGHWHLTSMDKRTARRIRKKRKGAE